MQETEESQNGFRQNSPSLKPEMKNSLKSVVSIFHEIFILFLFLFYFYFYFYFIFIYNAVKHNKKHKVVIQGANHYYSGQKEKQAEACLVVINWLVSYNLLETHLQINK